MKKIYENTMHLRFINIISQLIHVVLSFQNDFITLHSANVTGKLNGRN